MMALPDTLCLASHDSEEISALSGVHYSVAARVALITEVVRSKTAKGALLLL